VRAEAARQRGRANAGENAAQPLIQCSSGAAWERWTTNPTTLKLVEAADEAAARRDPVLRPPLPDRPRGFPCFVETFPCQERQGNQPL